MSTLMPAIRAIASPIAATQWRRPRVWLFSFGVLLACGPDNSDQSADDDAGSTDDTCVSLCGCPEAVELDYSATVLDAQTDETVEAVEVYCDMEELPITSSSANGIVAFLIMTEESPGCGYARCNQLRFHPTVGPWQDALVSAQESNGGVVLLQYPPD